MKASKMAAGAITIALAGLLAGQAAAEQPTVWLNVEVNQEGGDIPRVNIHLPLSLIEVVIDSVDTMDVMHEIHKHRGIDLIRLWENLRDAQTDEFMHIETDRATVAVFKDGQMLRMTVQEVGFDEPNVQVRIPYSVMDFVVDGASKDEFRLSELVEQLRGHLPLVLVEATRRDEMVRIWLEER